MIPHITSFIFMILSTSIVAQTLVRGPQVQITNDPAYSPVSVAQNSSGFVSVWQEPFTSGIASSFWPSGGTGWEPAVLIAPNASYFATIAGNSNGFVAVWVNPPPGGFPSGTVKAGFSNDNGQTWSVNTVTAVNSVFFPVNIAANAAGFMAVWIQRTMGTIDSVYTSFSANGTSWSTPVLVIGAMDNAVAGSLCGIAGNADGFMVSWTDDSGSAYSNFSSDNGMTWSSSSLIASMPLTSSYPPKLAASATDFIAIWQDASNNLQSLVSTDQGDTWPSMNTVQIASNLAGSGDIADPFVSYSSGHFFASWHSQDNNAYGAVSNDNGMTWSPVAITTNSSVQNGYYDWFVSVSGVATGAMFTWRDFEGFPQSNFASFVSGSLNPPTNLIGAQKKDSFGTLYELYNTLTWTTSTSPEVTGYNVFRNGTLIAHVGANTTSYTDHNQRKKETSIYAVTAVDAAGNQSPPATITVK